MQAYETEGFRQVTAIRPVYLQYLLLQGVNALWQVVQHTQSDQYMSFSFPAVRKDGFTNMQMPETIRGISAP